MLAYFYLSGLKNNVFFFRFLTGVCAAGNILASFVLASELVGPSKRSICGNIYQVYLPTVFSSDTISLCQFTIHPIQKIINFLQMFFALGIVLYSLLAYYVKDWRALSTLATCVGIPYIFLFM